MATRYLEIQTGSDPDERTLQEVPSFMTGRDTLRATSALWQSHGYERLGGSFDRSIRARTLTGEILQARIVTEIERR